MKVAPPPSPMQFPPPAPAAAGIAMSAPEQPADVAETVLDTTFHIAAPVDLARGHTASVPILDREMKAEQVDWLQAYATRPIAALRLTNDGDAGLPPGVLTLYTQDQAHGPAFAGDARLSGLPAGESRLLGFAEDLRMSATRSTAESPEMLVHIAVAQGIVHRKVRRRITNIVELSAPARNDCTILIEFPRSAEATLSFEGGPIAGVEQTANVWRVPVSLRAGQSRKLTAYADTVLSEQENLLSDGGVLDETVLAQFTADTTLDDGTRARLQPVIALQKALAGQRAALKKLGDAQNEATADEERVRNNLRAVTGPGDLHERLLAQLAEDEGQLRDLRTRTDAAQTSLAEAEDALADAVGKLDL